MLYMASPVATSAINTNRTKVVGTGLTMKSVIDSAALGLTPEAAKEWQQRTEAEFELWAGKASTCDALGLNNFTGIQQLALKSWLLSGDVFVLVKRDKSTPLMPYSLRLHVIEADRISTPDTCGGMAIAGVTDGVNPDTENKIYDGVEVNSQGAVVAYHIRNTYPTQTVTEKTTWTRVPVRGEKTGLANIFHIMAAERPDQYRGVPYLAQVIEPLLQMRRFTESELTAALIQTFYTAWIKTNTNAAELPFNEIGSGDIQGVPSANPRENNLSLSENEYELGSGVINVLEPDEDIVFGNPNIPSTSFDVFVKAICRQVGAALEVPYDVLLKEFDSSYSASRGALLEAWEGFRTRRSWFVDDFCQPAYETWLAEAVARGRIKAPGFFDDPLIRAAWCGAKWIGPTQGSLDPLKEAKAAILLTDQGIKTHAEVTRELSGGDWESNVEQLAMENVLLRQAGGGTTKVSVDGNDSSEGDGENAD